MYSRFLLLLFRKNTELVLKVSLVKSAEGFGRAYKNISGKHCFLLSKVNFLDSFTYFHSFSCINWSNVLLKCVLSLFFRIQVSGTHPTSYLYCIKWRNQSCGEIYEEVSGLKRHTARKHYCKFFDHQGINFVKSKWNTSVSSNQSDPIVLIVNKYLKKCPDWKNILQNISANSLKVIYFCIIKLSWLWTNIWKNILQQNISANSLKVKYFCIIKLSWLWTNIWKSVQIEKT